MPHPRAKGAGGARRKNGKRSMDDAAMMKLLEERIAAETPAPGTNPLADRMSADAQQLRRFDQVGGRPTACIRGAYARRAPRRAGR